PQPLPPGPDPQPDIHSDPIATVALNPQPLPPGPDPELAPVGASSSILGSAALSDLTLHEPSTISTGPLSSDGVLPVGVYHGALQALTGDGVLPIGVYHGALQALTGLDIDVSDPKHLLTGDQSALLKADMATAAKEWLDHIGNLGNTPI